MKSVLIATKLYLPARPPVLVHRPRLIHRLNEGLDCRLTLVSAPAGFGKTTLLSDWIHETSLPAAWITLDSDDNEPARFLRYLLAALDKIQPGFGSSLKGMLQVPHLPPIKTLIAEMINEIAENLPRSILLLDDYQHIDSQEIHEAVAFLLEHLPPILHLVLSSRSDPPLQLTRLRANKQVCELRAADLRFTPDEATVFLNSTMGLNLDHHNVEALEERTEGWIASLQLAALALKGRDDVAGFIQKFTGGHSYIVDYLTEEVLHQQPADVQEFLLRTSILKSLCAPLCNTLTGRTDGAEMLERLRRSNLFLIALDENRKWFRYHNLFGDLIRYRLENDDPELVRELHLRATRWLLAEGLVEDALGHALAAREYELAAGIIEKDAVKMLVIGDIGRLKRWIDSLPEEIRNQYAYISICSAWIAGVAGGREALPHYLATAEAALQGPHAHRYDQKAVHDVQEHVMLLQAYHKFTYRNGSSDDQIQLLNDLMELRKNMTLDNLILVSTANGLIGELLAFRHQWDAAREASQVAAAAANRSGNLYVALAAMQTHAHVMIHKGELRQAWNLCQRTLKEMLERGLGESSPLLSYMYEPLGKILYERNELVAASEYLERAAELADLLGNSTNIVHSSLALLWMKQAQGNPREAEFVLEKAFRVSEQNATEFWTMLLEAHRVRLWLAQKRMKAAERWGEQYERVRGKRVVFHEEREFAFARLLIATGDYSDARQILDQLYQGAELSGTTTWCIQALLLRGIVRRAQGAIDEAFDDVARALALAEPEGHIRTIIDEGEPVAELLSRMLSRSNRSAPVSNDYITMLLSALNKPTQVSNGQLVDPLTERELEVLRLLASGFSNTAIAEQLFLAIGTIKKHTHSIYSKLSVASRTQAIQRARELQIL